MVGWLVNCMLYEEYLKNTLKCCHFKSYYYPTTIEKTKSFKAQKCKVMHLLIVEGFLEQNSRFIEKLEIVLDTSCRDIRLKLTYNRIPYNNIEL